MKWVKWVKWRQHEQLLLCFEHNLFKSNEQWIMFTVINPADSLHFTKCDYTILTITFLIEIQYENVVEFECELTLEIISLWFQRIACRNLQFINSMRTRCISKLIEFPLDIAHSTALYSQTLEFPLEFIKPSSQEMVLVLFCLLHRRHR